MRISSKVNYVVLAMCELASCYGEYVSVAELAERQKIPQTFLEQLLLRLKHGGLTTSRRGPDGGYALALSPERIRIGDIYVAVEGPLNLCREKKGNGASGWQVGELLWRELEGKILEYLNSVTLEDLLKQAGEQAPGLEITHPYTFSI